MSDNTGASVPDPALISDQAASRVAPSGFDPSRGVTIFPVIHYSDKLQAMRNAERAFDAGCEGVMLIEMRGRNGVLPQAGMAIKHQWPDKLVGLNYLNATAVHEMPCCVAPWFDMTWTDEQLTHSDQSVLLDAMRLQRALVGRPHHMLFCGVAFKYQREEPEPGLAALRAAGLGFIPTASGPATGRAADPLAIANLRVAIGPHARLAVASGITPDNVDTFLPHVSHILVSTGVSSSFHEFDPARLRSLIKVRDAAQSDRALKATRPSTQTPTGDPQ